MQKAKVKPRCHTVSQVFTPLAFPGREKTAIAKADAAKKAAEDEASAEAAEAAMGTPCSLLPLFSHIGDRR